MIEFREKCFDEYAVGQRETFTKQITDREITLFIALSGDTYPLHSDEAYASKTRFGARIAHGMLTASLLSTVNAMMLGVPGGIYVSQTLKFTAPVYSGDTVTATSEVIELIPERQRIRCRTTCTNQHGRAVIEGEAVIQKDES